MGRKTIWKILREARPVFHMLPFEKRHFHFLTAYTRNSKNATASPK